MPRRTPTEMDAVLSANEGRIAEVMQLTLSHADKIGDIRREYEGEIKLLKDQVATLRAESKAREGHDAEIRVMKKEIEILKEDNKSWKVWFNALSAAVLGALALAAIGLRK